jgi:hypothetical protein
MGRPDRSRHGPESIRKVRLALCARQHGGLRSRRHPVHANVLVVAPNPRPFRRLPGVLNGGCSLVQEKALAVGRPDSPPFKPSQNLTE